MIIWNLWHGYHKVSEGCRHCYMYFLDRLRGIDTSKVTRNAHFDMPLKKERDGQFKIATGMELLVGLSTDFFVEEADEWRDEAWAIMRRRPVLRRRGGWGDNGESGAECAGKRSRGTHDPTGGAMGILQIHRKCR